MPRANKNKPVPTVQAPEKWGSRIGVVLAVAGGAIGIGNFLRFPGQVAQFGGGAFMIAYVLSFIFLGLPMCWAEWTAGRYAGSKGHHTIPGIMATLTGKNYGKYLGAFCLLIPVVVYCYFTAVQAWCLGYAVNLLIGNLAPQTAEEASLFFANFTGIKAHGSALGMEMGRLLPFLLICLIINYLVIAQGISRGIERCCKWAVPTLFLLGIIVLIRVLTLGTPDINKPDASISQGLGYMWNPQKVFLEQATGDHEDPTWHKVEELVGDRAVAAAHERLRHDGENATSSWRIRTIGIWEQLARPALWLAAAGQIFFSLAVGFGVIGTYASYLTHKDDIVLGALASASANEAAEVGLGGLITLPAAVAFLGVAGLSGQTSLFSLGFNVLPLVFAKMPGGAFFGFIFFLLLFISAITATLSMLQPGIAFLEATLGVKRKGAVLISATVSLSGIGIVTFFTQDLKAIDTLDFWCGNFLIYLMSTVFITLFAWRLGIKKAWAEAHIGADIKIPKIFKWIWPYVTPLFLMGVFSLWISLHIFGETHACGAIDTHLTDLFSSSPSPAAWWTISWVICVLMGLLYATKRLRIEAD